MELSDTDKNENLSSSSKPVFEDIKIPKMSDRESSKRNKLSSSEKYPRFYSYIDTLNSELFNGFHIVSGVQTKGGDFSFNSEFGPIELRFHDDKIEYLFISCEVGFLSLGGLKFIE